MPDTFYTDMFYPFMDKILSLLWAADAPFYLTGGTALGRHYLHHRYSDDLDLFVNQAADFRDQVKKALEARQKDLWVEPLEIARTIEEFPVDLLAALKWEQPVDPDACTAALKMLHSDIFHGSSNSLHISG